MAPYPAATAIVLVALLSFSVNARSSVHVAAGRRMRTRPVVRCARPATRRLRLVVRAEDPTAESEIKERLRQAEAEAAALRAQLEKGIDETDVASDSVVGPDSRVISKKPPKVEIVNTNPLQRGGRVGNDMAGPSEATLLEELGYAEDLDRDEMGAEIRKRFLIAGGGAAVLGLLGFIPTSSHRVPEEPSSYFLTPVIRSLFILDEIDYSIKKGRWKKELDLVQNILAKPNYFKKNIMSAAQTLTNDKDWKTAEGLGREISENVRALDYREFFQTESPTDEQGKFLLSGVQECTEKINQYLGLFPPSEVRKAQAEADRTKPAVARDTFDYQE